jgi:carbonic anhydrase/acetyltransferase-like protein (isoleucine patch superfamily)
VSDDSALFSAALREVYFARDRELRETYHRSLGLGDALFDRWERARTLGFEEGASIYNSAVVMGDVSVGAQSWVGPYVILDGSGGGISIGQYCSISAGVHVYTHDTMYWALSGGVLPFRKGAVRIGDFSYVASQCVIAAGVTIGNRCVIASNAFVNDDVPDGTIVGGTTARRIGRVIGEGASVAVEFFDEKQPRARQRGG